MKAVDVLLECYLPGTITHAIITQSFTENAQSFTEKAHRLAQGGRLVTQRFKQLAATSTVAIEIY